MKDNNILILFSIVGLSLFLSVIASLCTPSFILSEPQIFSSAFDPFCYVSAINSEAPEIQQRRGQDINKIYYPYTTIASGTSFSTIALSTELTKVQK